MFTDDQKKIYDFCIDACTDVINKKNQDSFWKNAEITFLSGFTSLMVLNEDIVDEIIANSKEPDKVLEIWNSVPDEHPTRFHFNQIMNMPQRIRSGVVIGAFLTFNQLNDVFKKIKAQG